jgi:hypothetical protein
MCPEFIKKNKLEVFFFALLLVFSGFLRFTQLGYSDYYGDEAKTLYWNKTVPAAQFLLNQRKGPVQFGAAWFMEQISGGFEEGILRLPFALAGFLAIPVLYILMRRKFGVLTAFVASFLFSSNGFYIAFSRIIQYQSFLILFGLVALLFADVYISSKKQVYLVLSGVSLGLAFFSHYDAVFFAGPTLILLWNHLRSRKIWLFLVPLAVIPLAFYVPYVLGGYFVEHTMGYLERRLVKEMVSSSVFTYLTYNPMLPRFLVYVFAPVALALRKDRFVLSLVVWFVAPLAVFEIIVSNPGTHIHNYVLPLILLSSIGVVKVYCLVKNTVLKAASGAVFFMILVGLFVFQATIYVPMFSLGYPWIAGRFATTKNQLFIYGFPYKRGWDEIAAYLRELGARSFYTTDNVTVGEFYLRGVPSDLSNPHFFVHIFDNQEFVPLDEDAWLDEVPLDEIPQTIEYRKVVNKLDAAQYYNLEKEVFVDDKMTALIYKRVDNK